MNSFSPFSSAFLQLAPLSIEQLRRRAPSAFATDAHSSRSSRYTYIPTSNIMDGMMQAGFQPMLAKQGSSRIEGKAEYTKHLIRFRHETISGQMQVGDTLPEIVLINSHDGTSAYKLLAGLFRLACANGLMVASGTLAEMTVPHKGNVQSAVVDGSLRILDAAPKALAQVQAWQGVQLAPAEQAVFANAAHVLRFGDAEGNVETPITPDLLLHSRRVADNGSDLWHTMNRVQENVIRGGLRARAPRQPGQRAGRIVTTREVRNIDQDVRLNRALWVLSEEMAKLRGMPAAAAA